MKKRSSSDFFWPSFTDLMTSLFFIMLVLYVLTYVHMKNQQKVTETQLNKIRNIQNAVKELPAAYFTEDTANKRFTLNRIITFPPLGVKITNAQDQFFLLKVGRSIEALINKLKGQYADQDISYVVLVEGMASKDLYERNYELSYQRALSLFLFWKSNGIVFDPAICEVQIAGSGTGGIGRSVSEGQNQRFLIQIIPKIGSL